MKQIDDLQFYIMTDSMMNRGYFRRGIREKIKGLFVRDYIMAYLIAMRKIFFYSKRKGYIWRLMTIFNRYKFRRLGIKLGFSIPVDVFGYGLTIPHYGTIVVGEGNKIGNYCVLHTSTCITAGRKIIGDAFYLSTGAKVINSIELGDGVTIGANSVVNKSYEEDNCLIIGIPGYIKRSQKKWYINDGELYSERVKRCEELRESINHNEQ